MPVPEVPKEISDEQRQRMAANREAALARLAKRRAEAAEEAAVAKATEKEPAGKVAVEETPAEPAGAVAVEVQAEEDKVSSVELKRHVEEVETDEHTDEHKPVLAPGMKRLRVAAPESEEEEEFE